MRRENKMLHNGVYSIRLCVNKFAAKTKVFFKGNLQKLHADGSFPRLFKST